MTDSSSRALERLADQGDAEAAERWLTSRFRSALPAVVRCGYGCERGVVSINMWHGVSPPDGPVAPTQMNCTPCQGTGRAYLTPEARMGLLAYCKDSRARLVMGIRNENVGESDSHKLERWTQHLKVTWGTDVLIRAAIAAAWSAFRLSLCDDFGAYDHRASRCSLCVNRFGMRNTIESVERWLVDPTKDLLKKCNDSYRASLWAGPTFYGCLVWGISPLFLGGDDVNRLYQSINLSVLVAGSSKAKVRKAICDSLCAWALGGAS